MANENPPRVTATKRTATATARAPRAAKTASAETPPAQTAVSTVASVIQEPVSTPQATGATARSAIIKGKATIDLDAVRRRAYELYEQRGCRDGFHEQDWYTAEQELSGRKQTRSQNGGRDVDSQRRDSQRRA
ncbi:MAG: DUF2934 domain-containing protein [Terriglobales bacterium]